jgi:hypothetical protein
MGVINIFGGIITAITFMKNDPSFGSTLIISTIILSILFFAVAKVLTNQALLMEKISNLEKTINK